MRAFYLSIAAFWLTMNGLLISREIRKESWTEHQRGLLAFLRGESERERWLSIYRNTDDSSRKVGYSGFRLEKNFIDGVVSYDVTVESALREFLPQMSLIPDAVNENTELRLHGQLELDEDLKARRLFVNIEFRLFAGTALGTTKTFTLAGQASEESDKFSVIVSQGEEKLVEFELSREDLTLSDGLGPAIPVADLEGGEEFEIPVFDPLSALGLGGKSIAKVKVGDPRTEVVRGSLMDVFPVETTWKHSTIRSTVTRGGEVLKQELGPPLNLELEHVASRKSATRGFQR
ncbi:MAG: hypothetical protein AAF517_10405 [Planctomycetota bacterium]